MIREALNNKKVDDFIYAGILSIKKDQVAKDGRTFHVLEISDSLHKAKLYLWSAKCDLQAKSFIKFKGEVVPGQAPFFSCRDTDLQVIDFNDLPQGCPTQKLLFKFNVDIIRLSETIKSFSDNKITHLGFRKIIEMISDEKFLSILKPFPAGKSAHHSLEGGLLKHIEEMLELYISISETSPLEGIRHEFVILGIILHDYYKHKEYSPSEEGFQVTENGSLLGHVYQGAHFLHKLIVLYNSKNDDNQISDLDTQKAVHVLLAHHGQLDWGSPVVPAIPEAAILHYIDQLSAKLNMFKYSNNMEYNQFLGTYPIK